MRYLYLYILLVSCYLLPATCNAQIITTIAGNGTAGYSGDGGQATNAELNIPEKIILDAAGNMYIADDQNNRIRKINTAGIITTIAGNGTGGYSGDGGQATAAEIKETSCICLDMLGNLYIADDANSRIRLINTTGIISTVVGNGTCCTNLGDGGQATAAECDGPDNVVFDTAGNLYISDYGNSRVRMINTVGIINTIAGNGIAGYSGDGGQAINAEINNPEEVAFDAVGNLYIADTENNRIRMVNTIGIINTIAGTGTAAYSGDGGQATNAELHYPSGIAFDGAGNLYISDTDNNRIRMVNTAGIISTIVGNGTAGYSGDGGSATAAQLDAPTRLTFDATGNLYFADAFNNSIRKVSNIGQAGINQVIGIHNQVTVYPNPSNGLFNLTISQFDNVKINSVEVYNTMGECVHRQIATSANFKINIVDLSGDIYFLNIETNEGTTIKKIIKQ